MDTPSDSSLAKSDSLVTGDSTWFNLDSPVLETDVGLVHLCFVASCIAIIVFRNSSQGFCARTQLLLWVCFSSNLLLKRLTWGYWWTWILVGCESLLCVLFLPSLRKQGIILPSSNPEKVLLFFILLTTFIVGYIHYEKTLTQNKANLQYLTPYMGSLYGLLGESEFHNNSKNALGLAYNESVLRSNPGLIGFLVGFKRALEGLAILPQYRNSLFVDHTLDWRVYSWTLSLGLYHLSLASMYFGKLHIVTLVQCVSWIGFVLLAGSKIGLKAKGGNDSETQYFDLDVGIKKRSYWSINEGEQRSLVGDDDAHLDIL